MKNNTKLNEQSQQPEVVHCDVLVIGAGAGGLATAITAKKHGLKVLVVEKENVFGGSAAFSGGVLWIPCNDVSAQAGIKDSREAAREFIRHEAGSNFKSEHVEAFLEEGPKMVEFFARETEVKFIPTLYPDYHPDAPGGVDVGRSILAAPFDIRGLGKNMARLRPPLQTITFMGMMFNSSNADLKHFFRATKSFYSAFYVAKRLTTHVKELLFYRKGVNVTSGNALAARLAKSAIDLDIPIWTSAPATELITTEDSVIGATVFNGGIATQVLAKKGVVLASGGFSHDLKRIQTVFPHVRRGGEHISPTAPGNTGDGARLAESVGGSVPIVFQQPAAWMPVSLVPRGGKRYGVFPHLLDRYKPGIIGVTRNGRRFTNESNSYHDVGAAMIEACKDSNETAMWLICDSIAISKYGLGYAKPSPMPLSGLVRNGYLSRGDSLSELAENAGIDPEGLEATVDEYNLHASRGDDPLFGRGENAFNRYLADPDHKPNPAVGPILKGPFYSLKLLMGDLGTFDGIRTTVMGQVLRQDDSIIRGLYAAGNDRASIMGGNYPGAGITLGPIMTFGYITGKFIAS